MSPNEKAALLEAIKNRPTAYEVVATIESGDADFNQLGMQWRGYFDFGVAMQDSRAAVKSKGEA